MKRAMRFLIVLMALLAVIGVSQGAMTGACSSKPVDGDGYPCKN